MQRYKNISGSSGVISYETGADYIKVKFKNNTVYLYAAPRIASSHIEKMKTLAKSGKGLGTYINQHKEIKENFILIS